MSDELERAVEEAYNSLTDGPVPPEEILRILREAFIQQRRRGWMECEEYAYTPVSQIGSRVSSWGLRAKRDVTFERDRRYPKAPAEPPIGEHDEETE